MLGMAGLAACGSRTKLSPGEASAPLQPDEGLALLSLRRYVREDCRDAFRPSLVLAHRDGSPSEHVYVEHPTSVEWPPDSRRANVIRYVQALRLKAGQHAFIAYTYSFGNSYPSLRVAPFTFIVTAGQATYIGGIGFYPEYFPGLGCTSYNSTPFYFSDLEQDRALFFEKFSLLSKMDIVDRSSLPREWRRGPEGFD
ncbi:hypothetical protein NON00_24005 [Roseomonas sp. GC11]|uniref:hypothetical protein n=1 Tax=Roseomonas sp. GC11 TaxID=2950546 RepID=UPI00210AE6A9|nr:hypothetical protein [Roseomonas sp. GC11]MCQ4162965.1 hypothetical protein [Roseomonas sp. GC11]